MRPPTYLRHGAHRSRSLPRTAPVSPLRNPGGTTGETPPDDAFRCALTIGRCHLFPGPAAFRPPPLSPGRRRNACRVSAKTRQLHTPARAEAAPRRLSGRRVGCGGEQSRRLSRERARLEAFEHGYCLGERARGLTTAPESDQTSAAE